MRTLSWKLKSLSYEWNACFIISRSSSNPKNVSVKIWLKFKVNGFQANIDVYKAMLNIVQELTLRPYEVRGLRIAGKKYFEHLLPWEQIGTRNL